MDNNLKIVYGLVALLLIIGLVLAAEGDYITSWDTSGQTGVPQGVCTDGNYIWVVDNSNNEVWKYNMDGSYANEHWDTSGQATDSLGIATDGNYIWVSHNSGNKPVFKYSMAGVYQDETWNAAPDATDVYDAATDGNYIYLFSYTDKEIHRFDMSGNYVDGLDVSGHFGTTIGVATDGYYLYTIDKAGEEVHKWELNGDYITTFDVSEISNDAYGMTATVNNWWIVDRNADEVYVFEGIGPVDTCTCPGAGENWEIDMSDYCNITEACDLTTGTLSFTGAGATRCNATITTTNLGDPGSSGILYIQDSCLINVKA